MPGDKIGYSRSQFPPEVPSIDTCRLDVSKFKLEIKIEIPCASNDIAVSL